MFESLKYFYEIFTGIESGEQENLLRRILIFVLTACEILLVYNFYELEFYEPDYDFSVPVIKHKAVQKIKMLHDAAKRLSVKNHSAMNLAVSIRNMNLRLFNDAEPEIKAEITPAAPDKIKFFQPPHMEIKAIMIAGKQQRAIVNTDYKNNITIRTGQKFLNGRVVKINTAGVIIDFGGVRVIYNAK